MTDQITVATRPSPCETPKRKVFARLLPGAFAFFATLLSLPIQAVTIPAVPLQSGSAYPPANVMFILDDSGSMEYFSMPHDVSDWDDLDNDLQDKFHGNNTIYYNPATTYLPWIKADNTRYATGMSYASAWDHPSLLQNAVDLSDETQTYFVPKAGVTDLTDFANFHRYQIREVGTQVRVVRSEYVRRTSGNEGVANAGCGGNGTRTWRNCEFATPTGRTEDEEKGNYATWYSYHRTRMKVAKAGASEAFSQLASNLRVGYDSIWNRSPFPIPVGTDEGLFQDGNRQTWFERLHAANGGGRTPLKGALQRAGEYFSDSSASGPWGPVTGNAQISCRQNFAILTTDGYWNDSTGYTSPVGDADNTAGPTVTNTAGSSYSYSPLKPYIDNFSTSPRTQPDTLADVAMYYWKRDLVNTLENNVPASLADPAFWQHMVTFGVSIGLQGKLNPKTDLVSLKNGSLHWGDPTNAEDADRIDDLWHASVNGHGSFVTARNPTEFVEGLLEVLTSVAARLGSASNVSTNSTSFTSDTRIFQATYISGKWTGELAAFGATRAGVATTSDWKASEHIPATGRNVLTWNGSRGAAFPTSAQEAALVRASGIATVTGAQNAAYIKGATTLEKRNGGNLRDRDSLLGDIVNSSPMYVKENETLFVGANDGMLHAIDASNGAERFTYIPGGVSTSDLATLSDPQYTNNHKYFVDGPVVVSTRKQTPDKNYLVGALGRGGKGVFGLDVTNAASFGTNDVLWERNGGANMGQVLGEPLIVTLNDTDRTSAVIVSNGINSSNGHAVLFVLDLATGAVISEIDTGAGGDNGLSAPRGRDIDANGTVDQVYAGDLKGNLWKFDLTSATPASWGVAYGGQPLFKTQANQPITGGIVVARNPIDGQRWIFFGTGSFMTSADLTDTSIQSMYGIIDDGVATVALSELAERQILVTTTLDGRTVRGFESSAVLPSGKKGWYVDLDDPAAGERIITRPLLRGNALETASIIPPTASACDAGGRGFINAIDAFTGTSLPAPFFDANGDGKFDDDDKIGAGGATVPVGSIDLGVGMPTMPTMIDVLVVAGGSKGNVGSVLTNPPGGAPRRIRWREILKD
ncbi:PilC/PilY family type IV pilus protein [Lysobacter sp. CFH 32150]|uniref:pilus assembly protein n=1 Tax=Lysobacter sp. CFH 32150 TaxID=2927128 RepID=UPI001FA6D03B|nr:PilC/PilY family type IV pilus protein [Lysobacter sp. CFH 32150]MCI4568348.1 pilus assembly protein [Lysobacter sp. CFH 32150]